jgi:hypothetical protein
LRLWFTPRDHPGMAIQFARVRYLSRASGGNAVRSAAYNARDAIEAERTGEVFYFRHRDAPEQHEVLLPEGAAEQFRDSGVLWNMAELAEKRRDAQVAREIVVALPADAGISSEDRIDMVRSFAEQHFVGKGLAVQFDVHAPHEGEAESERANWHAHLLITTRRVDGDKFSARKARDLDPEVRRAGGRAIVADGDDRGELWCDHQNRYFREHGIDLAVDPTAAHPAPQIGPIRMRVAGSEIVERADQIRWANEAAAHDPDQVLTTLTRHNAIFTRRDLDRFLAKHLADEAERSGELRAVLDAPAGGKSREVAWSASEFPGFRHGYAGTIYKGQGKTLDHTYLHHTHHWRRAASYVALTRQRESAKCLSLARPPAMPANCRGRWRAAKSKPPRSPGRRARS